MVIVPNMDCMEYQTALWRKLSFHTRCGESQAGILELRNHPASLIKQVFSFHLLSTFTCWTPFKISIQFPNSDLENPNWNCFNSFHVVSQRPMGTVQRPNVLAASIHGYPPTDGILELNRAVLVVLRDRRRRRKNHRWLRQSGAWCQPKPRLGFTSNMSWAWDSVQTIKIFCDLVAEKRLCDL